MFSSCFYSFKSAKDKTQYGSKLPVEDIIHSSACESSGQKQRNDLYNEHFKLIDRIKGIDFFGFE